MTEEQKKNSAAEEKDHPANVQDTFNAALKIATDEYGYTYSFEKNDEGNIVKIKRIIDKGLTEYNEVAITLEKDRLTSITFSKNPLRKLPFIYVSPDLIWQWNEIDGHIRGFGIVGCWFDKEDYDGFMVKEIKLDPSFALGKLPENQGIPSFFCVANYNELGEIYSLSFNVDFSLDKKRVEKIETMYKRKEDLVKYWGLAEKDGNKESYKKLCDLGVKINHQRIENQERKDYNYTEIHLGIKSLKGWEEVDIIFPNFIDFRKQLRRVSVGRMADLPGHF